MNAHDSTASAIGGGGSVTIIRTGVANTASVIAAFRRLGATVQLSNDPGEIAEASHVVLPGVGAFGPGMTELEGRGLISVLRQRIEAAKPLLAVCLGLQLLAESSDESPGARGLGILPVHVGRFRSAPRVPQMGWNEVRPAAGGCELLQPGYAYYANSFRIDEPPPGWNVAWTDYGGEFVGAIERGPVLGCQFHPELSGSWGASLLGRWLSRGDV